MLDCQQICEQIDNRIKYWSECERAVEKGSNEWKIFNSLTKNFNDLKTHILENE